jgi:hypothetical protein
MSGSNFQTSDPDAHSDAIAKTVVADTCLTYSNTTKWPGVES